MESARPIHPFQIPEIRCRVFRFLNVKNLARCARVERSWAWDARRFLWERVGGSRGLDWKRCTITKEALDDRAQFISRLVIEKKNMTLLLKLATCRSTLPALRTLFERDLNQELESFLDFVYLVCAGLKYLEIQSPCQVKDLSQVLGKAQKLEQLELQNLIVGSKSEGISNEQETTALELSSLTTLKVFGLKNGQIMVDSNVVALELGKLFESCPTLTYLTLGVLDNVQVVALVRVLPSLTTLKICSLIGYTLPDQDLARMLCTLTPSISTIKVWAAGFGVQSLNAVFRFRFLETVDLGFQGSEIFLPGNTVSTFLATCPTLQIFNLNAIVDGADLALGLPWICQGLKSFCVWMAGESRNLTTPELAAAEVPQELWIKGLGTHWMLYRRLSLFSNLKVVKVRLHDMNAAQHAFGHGYEQLRTLKGLEELYINKFQGTFSSLEADTIVDAWPSLKVLTVDGCTNPEGTRQLFSKMSRPVALVLT